MAYKNDEFRVKVAETLEKVFRLPKVGFEYVTDIEGKKKSFKSEILQFIKKYVGLEEPTLSGDISRNSPFHSLHKRRHFAQVLSSLMDCSLICAIGRLNCT